MVQVVPVFAGPSVDPLARAQAVPLFSPAADINPGSGSSSPQDQQSTGHRFVVYADRLYFAANDGVTGSELWAYDGVTATLVDDIRPGANGSFPRSLIVHDDKLYFAADNRLWSYSASARASPPRSGELQGSSATSSRSQSFGRV